MFTCVSWWIGDVIDNDNHYFLFLGRPEAHQKLHWYFHLTGLKMQSILIIWAILDSVKTKISTHYRIILRIVLWFQVYRILEYWIFRYQTPILVLVTSLCITILILFSRGK